MLGAVQKNDEGRKVFLRFWAGSWNLRGVMNATAEKLWCRGLWLDVALSLLRACEPQPANRLACSWHVCHRLAGAKQLYWGWGAGGRGRGRSQPPAAELPGPVRWTFVTTLTRGRPRDTAISSTCPFQTRPRFKTNKKSCPGWWKTSTESSAGNTEKVRPSRLLLANRTLASPKPRILSLSLTLMGLFLRVILFDIFLIHAHVGCRLYGGLRVTDGGRPKALTTKWNAQQGNVCAEA